MSERDDMVEQAFHVPVIPEPEPEKLGGDDYKPADAGWFQPWGKCPSCNQIISGWTDEALIRKMKEHCEETGCVVPELRAR